ncbi:MAG TPA: nuclear transport factor 2 family protein [Acidimicrobiia bacterium]|nr:nuclear transport factor 2 family protein [Acidimicrobiia bacterium]
MRSDDDKAVRDAVRRFLASVESRDPAAVAACFTPGGIYRNVPHDPAIGTAAIEQLFRPILTRSERVVWDIVSEAYSPDTAWLERVDRFWIGGVEYRIECNGVARVDTGAGLLTEFRDYVDLGVWRRRLDGVAL